MFQENFKSRSDSSRFRGNYGQWPTLPLHNFDTLSFTDNQSFPGFKLLNTLPEQSP